MQSGVVRVDRQVNDSKFDYPVVLFRVTLAESADGPATVEVSDSVPAIGPGQVFPEAVTGDATWESESGRQTATLRLEPGESVITGYAVRNTTVSMLDAGTASARRLDSTGGGSVIGRRVLAAAFVLLAVAAAAAGVVVLGLDTALLPSEQTPEDSETAGPVVTSTAAGPTPTPAPADTDDDGLSDDRERSLGTDPESADTDGDGVGDYRESLVGTDPTLSDTDGDGLADNRELELNTDPHSKDSDGDGLADPREIELGTDPTLSDSDEDGLGDRTELNGPTEVTDADTDGDGFPDGAEGTSEFLPGSDPLRKDIYIEIDATGDQRFTEEEAERVVRLFDESPVENPGNETGIDLHLYRDDRLSTSGTVDMSTYDRLQREEFDRSCVGYHYAILAPRTTIADAPNRDITGGAASLGGGTFVSSADAFTFMHELGHSLGLDHGPDVTYSRYPSMMNFNIREARYGYSDGTNSEADRDDWQFLEEEMSIQSTTAFTDPFVSPDGYCP